MIRILYFNKENFTNINNKKILIKYFVLFFIVKNKKYLIHKQNRS